MAETVEFASVGHLSNGLHGKARRYVKPGEAIPEGFLSPDRQEKLLAKGHLIQAGKETDFGGGSSATTEKEATGIVDRTGNKKGGKK